MTRSSRNLLLTGAAAIGVIGASALLLQEGIGSLLRRILGHPVLLVAALAMVGVLVALLAKRRYKEFVLATLVAVLLATTWAARRIHRRYPDNLLLSLSGYAKATKLLLGRDILLSDYEPRPALAVVNPSVLRAKRRAIDVHFHLESLDPGITPERLVAAMDSVGIQTLVNLDGLPERLEHFSRDFAERFPGRFINFTTLQLWDARQPRFVEQQTAWIEKAIGLGARGIKVWKALGLELRDTTGVLIPIDDPRFDFIWDLAGEVGLPVLIHSADPEPFFRRMDRFNERYVELHDHPEWGFYGPGFPPFDSLMAQRERLLRKHPQTVFVGAHVGNNAGDLRYAGHLLDTYPNYYVDISSRLSELGRQPRTTREFFIRYQDRILFATDGGFALDRPNWSIEKYYQTHFQFLETDAEYFDYPLAEITKQGSWKIYGLSLPDSVLSKVYAGNARRLIPNEDDVRARLRRRQGAAVQPGDPAGANRVHRSVR